MLAVRWWWLKGIQARQGGQAEEALEHFHRCESALRGRGREQRAQQGGGASSGQEEEKGDEFNDEDEEEVAVLLPYCSVHPRIDLQVRGQPGDRRKNAVNQPNVCRIPVRVDGSPKTLADSMARGRERPVARRRRRLNDEVAHEYRRPHEIPWTSF